MVTVVKEKVYCARHFESVVTDEVLAKIKSLGWEVLNQNLGTKMVYTK